MKLCCVNCSLTWNPNMTGSENCPVCGSEAEENTVEVKQTMQVCTSCNGAFETLIGTTTCPRCQDKEPVPGFNALKRELENRPRCTDGMDYEQMLRCCDNCEYFNHTINQGNEPTCIQEY